MSEINFEDLVLQIKKSVENVGTLLSYSDKQIVMGQPTAVAKCGYYSNDIQD